MCALVWGISLYCSQLAQRQVDDVLMANGQMAVLDADRDYTDPFLLPVDAYVCDTLKGLPAPMQQFVQVETSSCVDNPSSFFPATMCHGHSSSSTHTAGRKWLVACAFRYGQT